MKILQQLQTFDKRKYWMISFVLAAFSMFMFFALGGMLGGDYIVLRSDMYAGSMAAIKDIARSILAGDNPFFSYNTGMGLNNSLALAWGMFSPFNILYLIFFDLDENLTTAIILILKAGCCASSFQYFSRKVLKNDSFSSVVISLGYALSSYVFAYGTIHIMWIDAILILPLLCTAIIDCVENNKRVFLIILYTYLFVAQFYIAYMVGMFSLLFVVAYLLIMYNYKCENKIKEFFERFFNWVLSGVIAVLLSAVVWAPTLFFILANRADDSTESLEIVSTIFQIINSLFWGEGYGIEGTYAYIYCGVVAFLLVPLFFANKFIHKKEKKFYGVLLTFLFICTIFTPLNQFMHAFDQPDYFWYRYSFLISFCVCAVASKCCMHLNGISKKNIAFTSVSLFLLYVAEQRIVQFVGIDEAFRPSENDNTKLLINVLLIVAWIVLGYFYLKSPKKKLLIYFVSALLICVECIGGSFFLVVNREVADDYYKWYDTMEQAVSDIKYKDDGLFRVVNTNGKVSNSDTWFGFNGFSDFGDVEKYDVRRFLANVGFATSTRWVDDTGYTPVTEMLLGAKYNISLPSTIFDFEPDGELNDKSYKVNDTALGYAYLVDGGIIMYEYPGRNVFENMNELTKYMTGKDVSCFKKIPESEIIYDCFNAEMVENAEQKSVVRKGYDGELYVTVLNKDYDDVYLQFENAEPGNMSRDFDVMGVQNMGSSGGVGASFSAACKMFYNSEKDKYTLYLQGIEGKSPEDFYYDELNVYSFDQKALEAVYEDLEAGQLNIEKWSNGYIEGMVNVTGNRRLMFTSIPYDPGWTVYIDGIEVETVRLVEGAFLGFYLPNEGEHEVVMHYKTPGLNIGATVSLCGLIALLSVVFEKQIKKLTGNKTVNED